MSSAPATESSAGGTNTADAAPERRGPEDGHVENDDDGRRSGGSTRRRTEMGSVEVSERLAWVRLSPRPRPRPPPSPKAGDATTVASSAPNVDDVCSDVVIRWPALVYPNYHTLARRSHMSNHRKGLILMEVTKLCGGTGTESTIGHLLPERDGPSGAALPATPDGRYAEVLHGGDGQEDSNWRMNFWDWMDLFGSQFDDMPGQEGERWRECLKVATGEAMRRFAEAPDEVADEAVETGRSGGRSALVVGGAAATGVMLDLREEAASTRSEEVVILDSLDVGSAVVSDSFQVSSSISRSQKGGGWKDKKQKKVTWKEGGEDGLTLRARVATLKKQIHHHDTWSVVHRKMRADGWKYRASPGLVLWTYNPPEYLADLVDPIEDEEELKYWAYLHLGWDGDEATWEYEDERKRLARQNEGPHPTGKGTGRTTRSRRSASNESPCGGGEESTASRSSPRLGASPGVEGGVKRSSRSPSRSSMASSMESGVEATPAGKDPSASSRGRTVSAGNAGSSSKKREMVPAKKKTTSGATSSSGMGLAKTKSNSAKKASGSAKKKLGSAQNAKKREQGSANNNGEKPPRSNAKNAKKRPPNSSKAAASKKGGRSKTVAARSTSARKSPAKHPHPSVSAATAERAGDSSHAMENGKKKDWASTKPVRRLLRRSFGFRYCETGHRHHLLPTTKGKPESTWIANQDYFTSAGEMRRWLCQHGVPVLRSLVVGHLGTKNCEATTTGGSKADDGTTKNCGGSTTHQDRRSKESEDADRLEAFLDGVLSPDERNKIEKWLMTAHVPGGQVNKDLRPLDDDGAALMLRRKFGYRICAGNYYLPGVSLDGTGDEKPVLNRNYFESIADLRSHVCRHGVKIPSSKSTKAPPFGGTEHVQVALWAARGPPYPYCAFTIVDNHRPYARRPSPAAKTTARGAGRVAGSASKEKTRGSKSSKEVRVTAKSNEKPFKLKAPEGSGKIVPAKSGSACESVKHTRPPATRRGEVAVNSKAQNRARQRGDPSTSAAETNSPDRSTESSTSTISTPTIWDSSDAWRVLQSKFLFRRCDKGRRRDGGRRRWYVPPIAWRRRTRPVLGNEQWIPDEKDRFDDLEDLRAALCRTGIPVLRSSHPRRDAGEECGGGTGGGGTARQRQRRKEREDEVFLEKFLEDALSPEDRLALETWVITANVPSPTFDADVEKLDPLDDYDATGVLRKFGYRHLSGRYYLPGVSVKDQPILNQHYFENVRDLRSHVCRHGVQFASSGDSTAQPHSGGVDHVRVALWAASGQPYPHPIFIVVDDHRSDSDAGTVTEEKRRAAAEEPPTAQKVDVDAGAAAGNGQRGATKTTPSHALPPTLSSSSPLSAPTQSPSGGEVGDTTATLVSPPSPADRGEEVERSSIPSVCASDTSAAATENVDVEVDECSTSPPPPLADRVASSSSSCSAVSSWSPPQRMSPLGKRQIYGKGCKKRSPPTSSAESPPMNKRRQLELMVGEDVAALSSAPPSSTCSGDRGCRSLAMPAVDLDVDPPSNGIRETTSSSSSAFVSPGPSPPQGETSGSRSSPRRTPQSI